MRPLAAAALCAALVPGHAAAQTAQVEEPRTYGYFVGDTVARTIRLQLPAGMAVDAASLPRPGKRGGALELRRVAWRQAEQALWVEYQVLLSPPAPRVLEMPAIELRLQRGKGQPPASLRIDAWPVTVVPLLPAEAPSRRGFGDMQPDRPPPALDLGGHASRMLALAVVAGVLLLYLLQVYVGLPWWARRHRPFGQAWRVLQALPPQPDTAQRRAAWAAVHAALNRTAGATLLADGVPGFIAAHPRYAPLQPALADFFARSRSGFFAEAAADDDMAWLRGLARRLRDAERGAA